MAATILARYRLTFMLFFVTDATTTEIYTLSLHDALPISRVLRESGVLLGAGLLRRHRRGRRHRRRATTIDRKSTRLNSSHRCISYAVFCLKKKNKTHI